MEEKFNVFLKNLFWKQISNNVLFVSEKEKKN